MRTKAGYRAESLPLDLRLQGSMSPGDSLDRLCAVIGPCESPLMIAQVHLRKLSYFQKIDIGRTLY
jgi:hypothetical protein